MSCTVPGCCRSLLTRGLIHLQSLPPLWVRSVFWLCAQWCSCLPLPQVPFAANISCNHSCAHRLADDDFLNLQDSSIARARPAYITSIPAVAQARVFANLVPCAHQSPSASYQALVDGSRDFQLHAAL